MSETIREFLVKIGYQEQGRKDLEVGLKSVTEGAIKLGTEIKAAALAVQAAVAVIASHLEDLYFQSKRIDATVAGIQAIGFAAAQTGSSVEAARGSLENFGRFIRTIPNARSILGGLGVETAGRTTDQMMPDLLRRLNGMQPAVAMAWANLFGIDEKTLLAANDKTFQAEQARYTAMQQAAHFNAKKAADDSHFFMSELRNLGGAIGILQQKVASAFSREMGEAIGRFTTWLTNNFDKIGSVIEAVVRIIIQAGRIVEDYVKGLWQMARDVGDVWQHLDDGTKTFLLFIGTIIAGWLLLEAMTPLGIITALATALSLLWIDYQQWKHEGRESPIPWKDWEPVIIAAKQGLIDIKDAVFSLGETIRDVFGKKMPDGKQAMAELFDPAMVKKNIEEIANAIKWLPKTLEAYIKIYGGVATGNWRLALEGLQELKDQTMGEGGPTLEQALPSPGMALMGQPSPYSGGGLLNSGLRWIRRTVMGNTNDVAHPQAATSALPGLDPRRTAMAQESFNFWKARGFTDVGAAAMVAAEERESSFNIAARGDPNRLGEMTAHGSFQWHPDRRAAILAATGIDVSTASHQDQLRAAAMEAEQGLDPQWAQRYQQVRNAQNWRQATDATVNGMLRPGDRQGAMDLDTSSAQRWMRDLPPGYNPNVPAVVAPTVPRQSSLSAPYGALGGGISNDNSRQLALNQTNNINVQTSDGDGWAIGRAVAEHQRTAAAQTIRDMNSRVA